MKKIVYIIIAFWIALAAGTTLYNEMILQNGTEILLKVKPVDPRDLLRGDYVALHYEINTLPENMKVEYREREVYVTLSEQADKTYKISNVGFEIPKNKIFLKGELYGKRIYYPGIEKYFIKEGKGKEIEKKLQNGGIVKISAGKNGYARIKTIITD